MWGLARASSSTTLFLNRSRSISSRESRNTLYSNGLKSAVTASAKCGNITANASPKRELDPKKRVVITGMGLVSVFGSDVDTYYNKLLDGVSGITPIDKFDASEYSVRIAAQIRNFSSKGYINEKEDRCIDDCWRYCVVAGKRALEDANLGKQEVDSMEKRRMGVVVGSTLGGLSALSKGVEALTKKGYRSGSPFTIPNTITNMGSALLAKHTGFMGPSYAVGADCATANQCFNAAASHIRRGGADVMLAGGTDASILPMEFQGLIALGALSERNKEPHKASRPWDRDRDGFVLSEGAAVLVMESMEQAMKRGAKVYAEFLGGACTMDAHHMTEPHPQGIGLSSCIIKSLEDAGVTPQEVNYVNAHAASTPAGDLAEIRAIKRVFDNTSELKMNATKSIIGNALGASGGMEAIATIKAINTGWLHPTINQFELEAEVTIDTVPNVKKQHHVNVALSNSFGFGGQNSVVVLAPFSP